jgi:predicted lipoprotein
VKRLLFLVLITACGSTPLGDGPRKAVVRNLVDQVIVPTYADVAARTAELSAALDALEAAPDETRRETARAAWRAARIPWKESEAAVFGPAKDLRLEGAMDQWPADPAAIEAVLAGTDELTDGFVAELGANKKGFHGLEQVLFAATPLDARRLRYLAAAGRALAADAARLHAAWRDEYAARFIEAGDVESIHATIKAVVDTFVNEGVALTERISDTRLGAPMGKASGGTPRPELAESPASENSVADMAASLRGVRNLYFGTRDGTPGHGLDTLVESASPVIGKQVRLEILAAVDAVAALPPLGEALAAGDPRLETAYLAVKELKRALAADVTAALGATLKFNDNDGD